MIRYITGRLLQFLPVLFGVSLVVFLLVRLIPGDPAIAVLGSRATPQLIARMRDQLGLDLPLWRQYLHFLGQRRCTAISASPISIRRTCGRSWSAGCRSRCS